MPPARHLRKEMRSTALVWMSLPMLPAQPRTFDGMAGEEGALKAHKDLLKLAEKIGNPSRPALPIAFS
jgi:hypothetical protein